jgi:hypothetical protein
MLGSDKATGKSWQEIADEMTNEQDTDKLL